MILFNNDDPAKHSALVPVTIELSPAQVGALTVYARRLRCSLEELVVAHSMGAIDVWRLNAEGEWIAASILNLKAYVDERRTCVPWDRDWGAV